MKKEITKESQKELHEIVNKDYKSLGQKVMNGVRTGIVYGMITASTALGLYGSKVKTTTGETIPGSYHTEQKFVEKMEGMQNINGPTGYIAILPNETIKTNENINVKTLEFLTHPNKHDMVVHKNHAEYNTIDKFKQSKDYQFLVKKYGQGNFTILELNTKYKVATAMYNSHGSDRKSLAQPGEKNLVNLDKQKGDIDF